MVVVVVVVVVVAAVGVRRIVICVLVGLGMDEDDVEAEECVTRLGKGEVVGRTCVFRMCCSDGRFTIVGLAHCVTSTMPCL